MAAALHATEQPRLELRYARIARLQTAGHRGRSRLDRRIGFRRARGRHVPAATKLDSALHHATHAGACRRDRATVARVVRRVPALRPRTHLLGHRGHPLQGALAGEAHRTAMSVLPQAWHARRRTPAEGRAKLARRHGRGASLLLRATSESRLPQRSAVASASKQKRGCGRYECSRACRIRRSRGRGGPMKLAAGTLLRRPSASHPGPRPCRAERWSRPPITLHWRRRS